MTTPDHETRQATRDLLLAGAQTNQPAALAALDRLAASGPQATLGAVALLAEQVVAVYARLYGEPIELEAELLALIDLDGGE